MKASVLALILVSLTYSLSAQNLIRNGSCDSALVSGKIPYWQEITGTGWSQRTGDPVPYSGVGYFYPPSLADAELGQTIDLSTYASAIDSGILKFHFTGYVLAYVQSPADESNIVIQFADSVATIVTYSFGPYNQTTAWLKVDSVLAAPATTRKVNITLHSIRHSGSNNDGYYDELSLIPVKQCVAKTIAVTPDSIAICVGASAQLCAPVGYFNYRWNTSDSVSCINVNATGKYSLIANDINGCAVTSDSIPVTLLTLPPPAITVATGTICSGDSTMVCAPTGYTSYHWNVGDTSECIQAHQAGNYYVSVTDSNGCTVESVHEPVQVFPAASISIVVNGDTLSSFGAVTYQWYQNDTLINGATSSMYIATVPGNYSLSITDANGCGAMSIPVPISIVTSMQNVSEAINSIYPNPSSGSMHLQVDEEWVGKRMELYDTQGRMVASSPIQSVHSTILLPTSGVYFFHLVSPMGQQVYKLVRL